MRTKQEILTEPIVRVNASTAGLDVISYWRLVMPERIKGLSQHYKATQRAVAFEVSMDIIPYQRMRHELLPAFLANPHAIPMDTLVDQYGVDRRYVAASYLRAYEKHLAAHSELIPTYAARDPISHTIPHRVYLAETILRTGMDEAFLLSLLKRAPMPNTIGFLLDTKDNPEGAIRMTNALKAEKKRIDALREAKRQAAMRYNGTDRGTWEANKVDAIKAKAQRIADSLYPPPATAEYTPELVRLRALTRPPHVPTTVWRPRPSALLVYAHKHIMPLLPTKQAALLAARLHEQALHVLNHTPKYMADTRTALTERHVLAALTRKDPIDLLLPHSRRLPKRDVAMVEGIMRAHLRMDPTTTALPTLETHAITE